MENEAARAHHMMQLVKCTHPDAVWLLANAENLELHAAAGDPRALYIYGKWTGNAELVNQAARLGYVPALFETDLTAALAAKEPRALMNHGVNTKNQDMIYEAGWLGAGHALAYINDAKRAVYIACLLKQASPICHRIESVNDLEDTAFFYAVGELVKRELIVVDETRYGTRAHLFGRIICRRGDNDSPEAVTTSKLVYAVNIFHSTNTAARAAADAWTCVAKRFALCSKDMRGMIARMIWDERREWGGLAPPDHPTQK